jgi:acyl-CoA hydrolase
VGQEEPHRKCRPARPQEARKKSGSTAAEASQGRQVIADSIRFRIYSGIGGPMNFIRGAALSRGSKPIIALPSTRRRAV